MSRSSRRGTRNRALPLPGPSPGAEPWHAQNQLARGLSTLPSWGDPANRGLPVLRCTLGMLWGAERARCARGCYGSGLFQEENSCPVAQQGIFVCSCPTWSPLPPSSHQFTDWGGLSIWSHRARCSLGGGGQPCPGHLQPVSWGPVLCVSRLCPSRGMGKGQQGIVGQGGSSQDRAHPNKSIFSFSLCVK